MALSVVQHKVNHSVASSNQVAVTVTSTGAGNLLVVLTKSGGGYATTAVSDGTNSFTQFPGAAVTFTGGDASDCWYLKSSASGKTTITITVATSDTNSKDGWVWEVSGFTNPLTDVTGAVTNGTGSGTTLTGAAVTTHETTGFAVAMCDCNSGQVAAGGNPKSGNEFSAGGDIASSGEGGVSLISTTAASHQPVWTGTVSGDTFGAITAAFKEGAVPNPQLFFGMTPARYWINKSY